MTSKRNKKKPLHEDMVKIDDQGSELSEPKRRRPKWKADLSDDSFEYAEARHRRTRRDHDQNIKEDPNKLDKHKPKKDPPKDTKEIAPKKSALPKEEKMTIEGMNTEYVIKYVDTARVAKEIKERKIFNPEEYSNHLEAKAGEERKLKDLQE